MTGFIKDRELKDELRRGLAVATAAPRCSDQSTHEVDPADSQRGIGRGVRRGVDRAHARRAKHARLQDAATEAELLVRLVAVARGAMPDCELQTLVCRWGGGSR